MLAEALGWPTTVIVSTGKVKPKGLPQHYKIDIANRELKMAIEVDGRSHNCPKRRAADARKTDYLQSRGWLMFRFTNKEVDQNLNDCVQQVLSTISRSATTTTSL